MKRDAGVEDTGEKMRVRWEARNASGCGAGATLEMINVHERKLFLDGVKLIAIISEAASAGISLHADKLTPPPPLSSWIHIHKHHQLGCVAKPNLKAASFSSAPLTCPLDPAPELGTVSVMISTDHL